MAHICLKANQFSILLVMLHILYVTVIWTKLLWLLSVHLPPSVFLLNSDDGWLKIHSPQHYQSSQLNFQIFTFTFQHRHCDRFHPWCLLIAPLPLISSQLLIVLSKRSVVLCTSSLPCFDNCAHFGGFVLVNAVGPFDTIKTWRRDLFHVFLSVSSPRGSSIAAASVLILITCS